MILTYLGNPKKLTKKEIKELLKIPFLNNRNKLLLELNNRRFKPWIFLTMREKIERVKG